MLALVSLTQMILNPQITSIFVTMTTLFIDPWQGWLEKEFHYYWQNEPSYLVAMALFLSWSHLLICIYMEHKYLCTHFKFKVIYPYTCFQNVFLTKFQINLLTSIQLSNLTNSYSIQIIIYSHIWSFFLPRNVCRHVQCPVFCQWWYFLSPSPLTIS